MGGGYGASASGSGETATAGEVYGNTASASAENTVA